MRYFFAFVACSLCVQLALSDELSKKSREHERDSTVSPTSHKARADPSSASDASIPKHPDAAHSHTYEEAQMRMEDEERRRAKEQEMEIERAKQHRDRDNQPQSEAAQHDADKAKMYSKLVYNHQEPQPKQQKVAPKKAFSVHHHSEGSQKRQQLLFSLNYIKKMLNDPAACKALLPSSKERFSKEMRRLEIEVKALSWDEYSRHLGRHGE